MSFPNLITGMALLELLLGLVAVVALLFLSAPYGRHARGGWGPGIGARLGWHLMEAPALFGFVLAALHFLVGPGARGPASPAAWVLFGLWVLHYGDRDLLYPRRLQGEKPMPVVVIGLGLCFNLINGPMNGLQVGLGDYGVAWMADPRFLGGTALFLTGFVLNRMADAKLAILRKENPGAYAIPRGGLYELVSCPNYLTEILQWVGWALATWSVAGAAFAVFTLCNLGPRAFQHHRWYQEQFPDYPPRRKALLPYLL